MKRILSVALFGVVLGACSEGVVQPDLAEPQMDHSANPSLEGTVTGPYGASICSFYPEGTTIGVWAYPVGTGISNATAAVPLSCPAGAYAIENMAAGSYWLVVRALGPQSTNIKMPDWWVEPEAQLVDEPHDARDIRIQGGEHPLGRRLANGTPLQGTTISVWAWPSASNRMNLGQFTSGADGRWYDANGELAVLQRGMVYGTTGCPSEAGNTTEYSPVLSDPVVFGEESLVVRCVTRDGSRANNWTHQATDLWATMYPGVWGMNASPSWMDGSVAGNGWGVEYVPSGTPLGWRGLFSGALVISNGSEILSGHPSSHLSWDCDSYCEDSEFVSDLSRVSVVDDAGGRLVRWTFEDNGQTPGVNVTVEQKSWDTPGEPFIVLRHLIRNRTASSMTLNVGYFMDWDVAVTNPGDNVGGSGRDGRLMWVSDEGGTRYYGTLIIRKPAGGTYHMGGFDNFALTLQEQIDALSGAISQPTWTTASDMRYLHSAEAVTIGAGNAMVLWTAFLAGGSPAELNAAADAAEARVETIAAAGP